MRGMASGRVVGWFSAAAAFFVLTGMGVRIAEDGQVGYTNDASMWVFVLAGLCAYVAAVALFLLLRRRRARTRGRRPPLCPGSPPRRPAFPKAPA